MFRTTKRDKTTRVLEKIHSKYIAMADDAKSAKAPDSERRLMAQIIADLEVLGEMVD